MTLSFQTPICEFELRGKFETIKIIYFYTKVTFKKLYHKCDTELQSVMYSHKSY